MGNITSLYEIRNQWRSVVGGLKQAEAALRALRCEHQANCIADILDAAMVAESSVTEQLDRLSEIEASLLLKGTAFDLI